MFNGWIKEFESIRGTYVDALQETADKYLNYYFKEHTNIASVNIEWYEEYNDEGGSDNYVRVEATDVEGDELDVYDDLHDFFSWLDDVYGDQSFENPYAEKANE
jgi:hypothetical protein